MKYLLIMVVAVLLAVTTIAQELTTRGGGLGAISSGPPLQANLIFWVEANADASTVHNADACNNAASFNDGVECWTDQSGNSFNLTNATGSAEPVYTENGIAATKDALAYTSDFLTRAHAGATALNFVATSTFTIFMVFKVTSNSTEQVLISKYWQGATDRGWFLRQGTYDANNGALWFYMRSTGGTSYSYINTGIASGTATRLILTYDGSGTFSTGIKAYINNTLKSHTTDSDIVFNPTTWTSLANMFLGAEGTSGNLPTKTMTGAISEAGAYNSVLGATDRNKLDAYLTTNNGF